MLVASIFTYIHDVSKNILRVFKSGDTAFENTEDNFLIIQCFNFLICKSLQFEQLYNFSCW